MRQFKLTFLLAVLTLIPTFAGAQSFQNLGDQTGANNIIVQVTPSQPKPNQFITTSIESYATDLDRADISWFLNGKLEKNAIGEKTFLTKTGKAGSVTNILILIKTAEGKTIQQVLNIRPSSLDLIWEAQSYTPPFYRGKALFPYQGGVKIVAMPNILDENGGFLNPKTLVYTWSVNGDVVPKVSGYGKNFIFYNGSVPLREATISVEASSVDKKYTAVGSVGLSPQSPFALFYEESPIYGVMYNRVLQENEVLKNDEIKIVGIPYFIGTKNRESAGLVYGWQLNNQTIGDNNRSGLTFKQTSKAAGLARVSLQISNPSKIFQFTDSNLSLTFGQQPEASGANLFPTQ